jgi:hypothetical protein
MTRIITLLAALVLLGGTFAPRASAEDNTLGGIIVGGGLGALIGGVATGRAGGAIAGGIIGAAAGGAIASQFDPRGDGYYWYHGRCWLRWQDGSYHRVRRYHCYDD